MGLQGRIDGALSRCARVRHRPRVRRVNRMRNRPPITRRPRYRHGTWSAPAIRCVRLAPLLGVPASARLSYRRANGADNRIDVNDPSVKVGRVRAPAKRRRREPNRRDGPHISLAGWPPHHEQW
jgi:hypothetical protein